MHAVKQTRECHDNIVDSRVSSTNYDDNESENISGESIGGAALVRGRRLLGSLSNRDDDANKNPTNLHI